MSKSHWPVLNKAKYDELREKGYWLPLPGPQQLAIALSRDKRFREILFGGSRGGGKTDVSIATIGDRFGDTRARQLVIRKDAGDLADFEERAVAALQPFGAKLRRNPMVLSAKGCGRVIGGHLHDAEAYTKYQGHEYCRINIEELTQIPDEGRYEKLISSARSKYKDLYPQVFATTNPGGAGMGWVKKRFVAPDPDRAEVLKMEYPWVDIYGKNQVTHWQIVIDKRTGIWRAYIPATIDSNPFLLENDPDYVKYLDSLQDSDPELYRAWRFGDWDIQFGAVFEEFRQSKHTYTKFSEWGVTKEAFDSNYRVMGMDWGYNDECVLLWAMFDKITERENRAFIYRELHGNHKPKEYWCERIVEMYLKDPVDLIALPHDAYSHLGGSETIAKVLNDTFARLAPDEKRPRIVRADKLMKDRKQAAVQMIHSAFANKSDGKPGLVFSKYCSYLIDTLPTIIYAKESGGEELDPNNVDHALDSLMYTLMTANREYGVLINAAKRIEKLTKRSFTMQPGGRVEAKDIGIDIATAVETDKLT